MRIGNSMKLQMNPQEKAWKTRRSELCCICKIRPARNDKSKTCDQHCAGKLAWQTRLK